LNEIALHRAMSKMADIVAKVENRTTLKSRKLILDFSLLRRFTTPLRSVIDLG
jgi:hypothetical protein